jgi:acyl-coenzyme A synthetase/AMP-(fatty) acid ligase
VGGSTVALGYWQDAVGTSNRFVPDPRGRPWRTCVYKTGDVVQLDASGNFVFVGRADTMIKSRGYRVELTETEVALSSHPSVSEAVALALPDDVLGNRIVACVALVEDMPVTEEEIRAHCSSKLPGYMVPAQVRIVPSIPRTTTGKLDRQALRRAHFV